jgi:hypothetical protein
MGEALLTVFPNELIAGFWVGVLEHEGIRSSVKPQMGGYGMWGHDSFIPHGLYVASEQLEEARAILANDPDNEEPRS